jgi:hypothetical protein
MADVMAEKMASFWLCGSALARSGLTEAEAIRIIRPSKLMITNKGFQLNYATRAISIPAEYIFCSICVFREFG